jgi:hypothetical protein
MLFGLWLLLQQVAKHCPASARPSVAGRVYAGRIRSAGGLPSEFHGGNLAEGWFQQNLNHRDLLNIV